MKLILPPDLTIFQSNTKMVNCYELFFEWVARNTRSAGESILYGDNSPLTTLSAINYLKHVERKRIAVGAVKVSEDFDKYLKDINIAWLRKYHKMGKARAKKEIFWLSFGSGPSTRFNKTEPDLDFREVLVETNLLDDIRG